MTRDRPGNVDALISKAIRDAARENQHYIRGALDNIFTQLESLVWLKDMLALDYPLQSTRGWAASPDMLMVLAREIESLRPQVVVELGSGVSTIVIAAALRRWGQGRLVALEHDALYAARTTSEIAKHGLSPIATVIDAPLGDVLIEGQPWRWYCPDDEMLPTAIELVFVDGPPAATGPMARYPALPVLLDRLAPSSVVLIDDGNRPDEMKIVGRWTTEFPEFDALELKVEKGGWLLRRFERPARRSRGASRARKGAAKAPEKPNRPAHMGGRGVRRSKVRGSKRLRKDDDQG